MRVSVTEMAVWQECPLKWWYKYHERARSEIPEQTGPMLSGAAIHAGLETALLGDKSSEAAWLGAQHFFGDNEEGLAKFGPGVKRALMAAPKWLWEVKVPQVELKLEETWGRDKHVVVGKPDLWWVDGTGAHIVEFKSTSDEPSRKLMDYQPLGNPQPLRYAVLVEKYLKGTMPMYVRHLIFSTQGKMFEGAEAPVSRKVLEREETEMREILGKMMGPPIWHRSWQCGRCAYREVDEVRVTGGDWESMLTKEGE